MGAAQFSRSPLGYGEAATQAKYESLGTAGVVARFRVDILRGTAYAITELGSFPDKNNTRYMVKTRDPGFFQVGINDSSNGEQTTADLSTATLPANGNDVVVFLWRGASSISYVVAVPDGAVLFSGTVGSYGAEMPTGAGTGDFRAGPSTASGDVLRLDAIAVTNANRTGVAAGVKPLAADSDVVGVYYFTEDSGATTADSKAGGTALSLVNNTWQTANGWEAVSLVADDFQFVAGTVPDPIVAGTPYTLEVEAIDTTQSNARVTSYSDPSVVLGVDVAVPVGYEIVSGDLDQPMAAGLASFPSIVFAAIGGSVLPAAPQRKVVFTTSPSVPQTSGALFTGNVVGSVRSLNDAVDTEYVTPVTLIMRGGAGSVIGNATVTPVAGVFTFTAVGVRLTENTAYDDIYLGIEGFEGQTVSIPVQTLQLLPTLLAGYSEIPRTSNTPPVAVVQVVGPITGGTLQLEATANGSVWSPIDFTPYVGDVVSNSLSASFFGRVSVEGLTAVRVRKSVLNVAYSSCTLSVFGG
jgi:hypothetical protein